MESFSEGKDREIYFELKRISNAVHFSLDDHFHYGFKGKPLAQIVCEDMGIYPSPEMTEEEERNVRNIETYINSKIAQLKENSLSAIRSGTFKWSL
jgi:ribosomal protein S13